MGHVLDKVHVLLVLLKEVRILFLEDNILLGIVKVSHSKYKHLQLLLRHGGDHVALKSTIRIADVRDSTLHGIHNGHFGNIDHVVPSLPKEFDGRRNAGIAASLDDVSNLTPMNLVRATASVAQLMTLDESLCLGGDYFSLALGNSGRGHIDQISKT